ncbi:MAG: hypothetical protein BMS9Abin28_2146 [Anaerolineae bacterium]|nr:MAG: hypothetical protein BMS9Abin28_2146 [Anaerolineae bacterium]
MASAIDVAQWIFSKDGLWDCGNRPDDGQRLTDDVPDLWFDFLCEYGEPHRSFDAGDQLTYELVNSIVIDGIRKKFYEGGGSRIDGTLEFVGEFFLAWIDFILQSGKLDSTILSPTINLSHFIGSFDYSVVPQNGGVQFEIRNRTDRSSGTHFPGRFPPQFDEFMETLAGEDASFASSSFIGAYLFSPVVSVLEPKTRTQTSDFVIPPEGGGVYRQTFVWTENYVTCEIDQLGWPQYLNFIEID